MKCLLVFIFFLSPFFLFSSNFEYGVIEDPDCCPYFQDPLSQQSNWQSKSNKSFVIGQLEGQLGNQLFQIANAVSVALDNNAMPLFPDLKNCSKWNIPLNYHYIFYRLHASQAEAPISIEYREPYFHFTKIPYEKNMLLKGYFQSEKYFKHHKDTILKLFAPSEEIKAYLQDKYGYIIDNPKTVSIHVRMYKDTKPEYHPFVGWNYIHKAVRTFDHDSLFIVFSDQIEFCKKKLKKLLPDKNLVFIEENLSHIHDLYLMSMCKHHIISNSSFSWWGAYLNQNPNKIVITPSPLRWFGPGMNHCNTKDILPEEWKVLF